MSLLERMSKPGGPGDSDKNAPPTPPRLDSTPDVTRRAGGALKPELMEDKARIHSQLVDLYASAVDVGDREEVQAKIVELTERYMRTTGLALSRRDFEVLVESLVDDVLGLGPLEGLLADSEISEIMINHPQQVYVERKGRLTLSDTVFESDRQLRQVIDRVVSSVGRRVDESSPMCDARLADGSRVNVVIPPLALKGACMSIRKFSREKLGVEDMLRVRSGSANMLRFLEAAVRARLNVVISGGTSSGKTTLLNVLSTFIPSTERIVTIEDAAELSLQQQHVITLEARPPNVEGKGAVPIRALVVNSLRMRPDRIIVGECRGGEALDMLQAMNTGHDGSMSTVHANSPIDAVSRLETMVMMAGAELPARAIQKQIASAVDILVQAQRLRGGARRITSITELTGLEGGEVTQQELFAFRQMGVSPEGSAYGFHTAMGAQPVHLDHLAASGEDLPLTLFQPTPVPTREEMY
jgi:pilus assembly protein CpaF